MRNLLELPPDLPIPTDDGKADHLTGLSLTEFFPDGINLKNSEDCGFSLPNNLSKKSVLFIFPAAGSPLDPNNNPEEWDKIPGARGCTPQSCGYSNLAADFDSLGVSIYGLSVQLPKVLREVKERNHLKYTLLSDSDYQLTKALSLPTFSFQNRELLKRMALYIEGGTILKVFYPVFPPDKNAKTVLDFLNSR